MNASSQKDRLLPSGAITMLAGTAVSVRGNDIDTDQIIPARYMKVVTFDGLGEHAFHDLRLRADGSKTDHPFNDLRFQNASVLISNRNFGCGSSREHAPQALLHAGIRAIIAESYAEIFAGNCNALGIAAVTAASEDVLRLQDAIEADPMIEVTIDLRSMTIDAADLQVQAGMPDSYRSALLAGQWDTTAVLLSNREQVEAVAARLPYVGGFAS